MENLNKFIKFKNKRIKESKNEFSDLFNIIHDQDDRIFAEYIDAFKIRKVSYNDLNKYIHKMASFLAKYIDEPKNSYIGILMENSINFISLFWALLMIGYKPLLLNAKLPTFLNEDVVKMVNCNTVITDDSFDNYKLNVKYITFKKNVGITNDILFEKEYEEKEWANEIALTTTATSLNVKVCVYNGYNFKNILLNTKYILTKNKMIKKHYKGSLKQLAFLPLYHIFGLVAMYFWFATFGRTFVFLNDYSSNTILKTVRKHEVTHVFAVPLLWHTMYKEIIKQVNEMDDKTKKKFKKGIKFSLKIQNAFPGFGQKIASKLFKEVQSKTFGPSIKFMISGGGYISNDAIKILNAIGYPLYNGYGSTEIGITSVELRNKAKNRIETSIGKPFPSVNYKIEDGILYVKGESICSKIISKNSVFDIDHDKWFNINDLASVDKKGNYYISGRNDDVYVNTNGEKINPDSIEKELKFSSLEHYVVLGLEKDNKKELALILEINKNKNDVILRKIMKEVQDNIHMLETMNYHFDNIYYSFDPICNQNAIKVSRKALIKMIEVGQVHIDNVKNFDIDKIKNIEVLSKETCEDVKKIMANIINIDVNTIADNSHFIFDLGGSSLDYCTLLMELKKNYEIEFDLKETNLTNPAEFSNYIIKKLKD